MDAFMTGILFEVLIKTGENQPPGRINRVNSREARM
jgi:hypothetical protein